MSRTEVRSGCLCLTFGRSTCYGSTGLKTSSSYIYNGGDPIALAADAQHVGDDVVFCESSQLFESPAHGEKFDIRGYYYGGPGARGLARFAVRIDGDNLLIDTDHRFQGPPRGSGPPQEPQGPFCIPG